MDGVGKQAGVALCILTDALHQLGVFFCHIVQLHRKGHLLPVGQRHLCAQTTHCKDCFFLPFLLSPPALAKALWYVLDRL